MISANFPDSPKCLMLLKFHISLPIFCLFRKYLKVQLDYFDSPGRSRKILKNKYLIAKIGVDTAENEPIGKSDLQIGDVDRPAGRGSVIDKEWIEILKFWIQFFANFGNFTDFSSKFCKIYGIFNEFRHFGTCSRNPKFPTKFHLNFDEK